MPPIMMLFQSDYRLSWVCSSR